MKVALRTTSQYLHNQQVDNDAVSTIKKDYGYRANSGFRPSHSTNCWASSSWLYLDCFKASFKMVSSTPSTGSEQQEILYDNGATLMASGALALHDHVASRMQAALGRRLPQVEVRYKDVSISANIVVKDAAQVEAELPTIANVIKQSARSVGGKRHVVQKSILRNVSGVFKPGTMTLVLGQPGSGKSSLMKLLSGRFPTSRNVSIEGDVAFNGSSRETLMKKPLNW